MIKKMKKFAIAMLLAGATVTATKAETLYETLSVNLVLTYQATATTNSKTGEITDTAGKRTLTTAQFIQLIGSNFGTNLNKDAALVRVTTLTKGTNFSTLITNATTLLAGNTEITNVELPTQIVWQNNTTNGPAFVTNSSPEAPTLPTNASYSPYSATNFTNYIIQGIAEPVILGNNVQYFIHNASSFTDTNFNDTTVWVPLSFSSNNAALGISTFDEAWNFQDDYLYNSIPIDDENYLTIYGNYETNYYFGDYYSAPNVEFFMAQLVTNLNANVNGSGSGPIFVGTIKPDMAMTGTLEGDSISINVGYPNQPIGAPSFLANFSFGGSAVATATTSTVGSGKTAMPFTSWNATFDVTGYGWLGGTDTNTVNLTTNFDYSTVSSGVVSENPGFYEPGVGGTSPTNPPAKFTNSFTYITTPTAASPSQSVSPGDVGFNPPLLYTNVAYTNTVTPDYTVYDTGTVTNIYTNVSTNVYTFLGTNISAYTNLNVVNPTNQTFSISGTVKQATTKVGPP
jgi:hypothetical protein